MDRDPPGGHVRAGTRFLGVGVVNTVVGLLVIFACRGLVGLSDALANLIGYAIGLSVSFTLNRRFTFRHQGAALPAMARFAAVITVAYAFNLITVLALIGLAGFNPYLAQTLGIVPYTVTSYFGSWYFVFRPKAA